MWLCDTGDVWLSSHWHPLCSRLAPSDPADREPLTTPRSDPVTRKRDSSHREHSTPKKGKPKGNLMNMKMQTNWMEFMYIYDNLCLFCDFCIFRIFYDVLISIYIYSPLFCFQVTVMWLRCELAMLRWPQPLHAPRKSSVVASTASDAAA